MAIWWSGNWPRNLIGEIMGDYLESFVPLFTIYVMLVYAKKHLNFTNRFLKYAAEGSYPFYILHQSVIVFIAYYIVQWNAGVPVKYIAIVIMSVIATAVLYDVLVKRTGPTRFLFGMRPLPKSSAPALETTGRP